MGIDGDSPQGVRLQERVEKDSINDNSDEVPEFMPVILVRIYFYFAANSFRRKRGTLTSCAETKSKGEKLSLVCKTKNYGKSLVQAHALFFAFYKWA